jgi:hypothetical protein
MATDRRRFFAAGLAAASGLSACGKKPDAAPAGQAVASGPVHVFLVENGQLGQAGFSVGLLATRDPAGQVLALATLRRRTKFRTDLAFASTNRWKLAYLEPAFRHLAESRDPVLASVVASRFADWTRQAEPRQLSLYFALYQRLLESVPAADRAGMVVHLTRRSSKGARDGRLQAALQTQFGPRASVALDGARFKDLVELAATVFGSIRYAAGPGRSRTKRRTVELLAAALKVPRLDLAALNAGGRISTSSMAL